jgi:hypothetical protein
MKFISNEVNVATFDFKDNLNLISDSPIENSPF